MVDNTNCKKPVEKYICKYYNLQKKMKKPMYSNEKVIRYEEKSTAKCNAGQTETFEMNLFVPDNFYID